MTHTVMSHLSLVVFLLGLSEHQHIDSVVLSEVCQKLSVKREEVLQAVRSGDRGHHLAVAYELVQDNRYALTIIIVIFMFVFRLMQSHTQPGDDSHLLATSPITSSFIIVDTLLETDHSQRDSLTITSPIPAIGGTVWRELFLLHFLMRVHVFMLHRNFELIPIKIGFFMNF